MAAALTRVGESGTASAETRFCSSEFMQKSIVPLKTDVPAEFFTPRLKNFVSVEGLAVMFAGSVVVVSPTVSVVVIGSAYEAPRSVRISSVFGATA